MSSKRNNFIISLIMDIIKYASLVSKEDRFLRENNLEEYNKASAEKNECFQKIKQDIVENVK